MKPLVGHQKANVWFEVFIHLRLNLWLSLCLFTQEVILNLVSQQSRLGVQAKLK